MECIHRVVQLRDLRARKSEADFDVHPRLKGTLEVDINLECTDCGKIWSSATVAFPVE